MELCPGRSLPAPGVALASDIDSAVGIDDRQLPGPSGTGIAVFHSQDPIEALAVYVTEDVTVIDLAGGGLVPPGIIADLNDPLV